METVNLPAEFVKDEEKAIPCPSSLQKPAKQIKFAPLTGQQIADFFSLTQGTNT